MAFSAEQDPNQPAIPEPHDDVNDERYTLVRRRLIIGSTRFGGGVAIAEVMNGEASVVPPEGSD